jgi:hypothetical protein
MGWGESVRILIITHSYAPELTPRAFRWAAIARSFAALGHKVDIVCARSPGTPAQESAAGVEVHRVRDPLSRSPVGGAAGLKRRSGLLYRFVRWLYRHTWRRLYWPDYACGWYFPAVRRASTLLAEHRHDWIVSVSHPFTGHLVGLALKRRSPKVRWLVDVGDPFCLMDEPAPNNAALYQRLSLRADRAVLHEAEVVSVTTSGTRDAYARIFPESAAKIHIIPPMLSLPTGAVPGTVRLDAGPLRLVYVGTLYRTLRSPAPLLSLFENLIAALPDTCLELHFLGYMNDCADLFRPYEHWLGSRIFVHGVVSRERAQQTMEAAHILVNLGNRSATQLPSKVIEYVAMGKPILNLVTIRDDNSIGILASYPAALTLHVDGAAMSEVEVQKIAKFVANPPEVMAKTIRDWLTPYTGQSVSQDYLRLLLSDTVAARETACNPNSKLW